MSALKHVLAKHGVEAVEMSAFRVRDEELGPVGVGAAVGHGEDAGADVLFVEALDKACRTVVNFKSDGARDSAKVRGKERERESGRHIPPWLNFICLPRPRSTWPRCATPC